MTKSKTILTESSVAHFINTIENATKRNGALELVKIMQEETGFDAKMWGQNNIGFGRYHYKYESGHEGDAPLVAFSPKKEAISLYIDLSFENKEELLSGFGKHKVGKGCIYIKKIANIEVEILKKIISLSVENLTKLYPNN